jgi:hypothetical protein
MDTLYAFGTALGGAHKSSQCSVKDIGALRFWVDEDGLLKEPYNP